MPQADLYYSADQTLAPVETLQAIQTVIGDFDTASGVCKGRAHRVADFLHSHVFLSLSMLPKPHRDEAFARELGARLAEALKGVAGADCTINVQIRFDLIHYTTVQPR
ncbi:hypothetical protein [Brevundimonas sp. GCM10030266]|uniref:hypothetical protein n=1 Tax=Brevundimonas sp. GCM10030266 TaxID=3273386 RepID=UPI003620E7B9